MSHNFFEDPLRRPKIFSGRNAVERQRMLASYFGSDLSDDSGRKVLARYLLSPIKRQLLYEGVLRKAFHPEELLPGASPYYDKDPRVPAYVVTEESDSVMAIVKSKRIDVPMFEIAANPMIPWSTITEKRFDIVERSLEQAKSSIMEEEDIRGFNLMFTAATENIANGINSLGAPVAQVTPTVLADVFGRIEGWRLRVSRVFMNPVEYADVRKFDRDILDPQSQAFLLKTGIQNSIWGAHIVVSTVVPVGTVFVVTEPEYFGRMPIRTDLQILTADDNKARMVGFSLFEMIGMAVTNPLGVMMFEVDRT